MKVIILCGGKGIRLSQHESYLPKAMVRLGHRPLVWHIMKRYAFGGYTDFVLSLGYKGEMIRDYFTRYDYYVNDIRVSLESGAVTSLTQHQEADWKLTLVDTGDQAMSGARIHRCREYITENEFMVTYSDCLANLDIKKLVDFHQKSKRIATVTGVIPPYREGDFIVQKNLVVDLYDAKKMKNQRYERFINGGYMVFNRKIFSYLNSYSECRLESEVFSQLIKDKQLAIYPHHGFWRWLDTDRDYQYFNDLVDKNKMYWLHE